MKRNSKCLMIMGVLIGFLLLVGCKSDEILCKSVPQGEFVKVE